jgi:uncharacterized protein YPO0396
MLSMAKILIKQTIVLRRKDLMARHEKAGVIITQQIAKAAQSGVKKINVVCEDTAVYVHLNLFLYAKLNLSCCFTMEGPSAEQTAIDIGSTAH